MRYDAGPVKQERGSTGVQTDALPTLAIRAATISAHGLRPTREGTPWPRTGTRVTTAADVGSLGKAWRTWERRLGRPGPGGTRLVLKEVVRSGALVETAQMSGESGGRGAWRAVELLDWWSAVPREAIRVHVGEAAIEAFVALGYRDLVNEAMVREVVTRLAPKAATPEDCADLKFAVMAAIGADDEGMARRIPLLERMSSLGEGRTEARARFDAGVLADLRRSQPESLAA